MSGKKEHLWGPMFASFKRDGGLECLSTSPRNNGEHVRARNVGTLVLQLPPVCGGRQQISMVCTNICPPPPIHLLGGSFNKRKDLREPEDSKHLS